MALFISMIKNSLVEDQDYMSAYVPAEPIYVHQEYPKWVHHVDGRSKIVNDADEEASLGEGWGKVAEKAQSIESELDSLIAQAESLGIKIDNRWGVKRLREEIEKAS